MILIKQELAKQIYISNDKSSVQLLPRNYKHWFRGLTEFQSNQVAFSKLLYHFSKYMETVADKVIHLTHKYKSEFYFPYYQITQTRRIPFSVYINFNYIEFKNRSGFNYIKHRSDFEDLQLFIEEIINNYLESFESFLYYLDEKWNDLKDSKGFLLSKEYDRKLIDLLRKDLFLEYRKSKEVAFVNISVTCDIHFGDSYSKNLFFDVVKNLKNEDYKVMVIEDETVFFYPFNKNLQIINRNIPKIRFYDKQKDTVFRYYKKRKAGNHYFLLKSYDDVTALERFEAIDVYSQESELLDQDFGEALSFLNNVIRFELEFPKKSIKAIFKENNIYKIKLNNDKVISDYLNTLLDMQTTSFKDTIFYDQVTKEKVVINYHKIAFDELGSTGDVTEKFNFVVKNAEFLNRITFTHSIINGKSKVDPYSKMSQNTIYSRVKRLRQDGVVRGHGKNIVLIQPYQALLSIYNHYYVYNYIGKLGQNVSCHAEQVRSTA